MSVSPTGRRAQPADPLASGAVRAGLFTIVLLAVAALATGITVVYVKYLTRVEFVELQTVRAERDVLDVEWGRLQLEEAAWATQMQVEKAARAKLDMHIPQGPEVRIVEVIGDGPN